MIAVMLVVGVSDRLYANEFLPVIRIIDRRKNTILHEEYLNPNNVRFALTYTHSVDGTPVIERYRIDLSKQIIIYEMLYKTLGAGMEFNPPTGRLETDGSWFVIRDMHRVLNPYLLRVGDISNPYLVFDDSVLRLLNKTTPGTLVEIQYMERKKGELP